MSAANPSTPSTDTRARFWREPEFWLAFVLAVAVHVPRLTTLPLRGEESRRALVARGMLESGDWIVPRVQGIIQFSRPPLQNWLIAAAAALRGEMTVGAIRLPGVLATISTVLSIYVYARGRFGRSAALLAAVSYATMLHVLELGRLAETESLFTLLCSGALLAWHGLWSRGTRPLHAWIAGGVVCGLATLTKGLQAPCYFFGSVWTYLVVSGQGNALFRRSHLAGLFAFVATVGPWQAPFLERVGLAEGWAIYFTNVHARFDAHDSASFVRHLLTYPLAVFFGSLAPWSLLLLSCRRREVRQRLAPYRDPLTFVGTCLAVCLPTVWLAPGAVPRYFMPLFPCVALLIGIVGQTLFQPERSDHSWIRFVRFNALAMGVPAAAFLVLRFVRPDTPFALSWAELTAYGTVSFALAGVAWKYAPLSSPRGVRFATTSLAAFLGITYVGPITSILERRSENLPAAVARLNESLPSDATLVSFHPLPHSFLFACGRPVELREMPRSPHADRDVEYFCVTVYGAERPTLPFAWEEVAALSVDRHWSPTPKESVVIGRRTNSKLAAPKNITRTGRF